MLRCMRVIDEDFTRYRYIVVENINLKQMCKITKQSLNLMALTNSQILYQVSISVQNYAYLVIRNFMMQHTLPGTLWPTRLITSH